MPPTAADFSFSGGIGRSVYLIKRNKVGFDTETYAGPGVFIETPAVSEKSASVSLHSKIKNETGSKQNLIVIQEIIDNKGSILKNIQKKIVLNAKTILNHETLFSEIQNPQLWSPENPNLYTVHSTIKDAKTGVLWHEITNPLAFRWFKVDNSGFYLNGQKLKLRGAARHQDCATTGMAVPLELNRKDMVQLKDMGANFARICHYPQDESIYKACDELGLIVWSEIPIVNEVPENESFYRNSKEMLKEMIYQNYNHPSIVMWGYMNEVSNYHPKAIELADSLENILRKIDKNRLSTVAFHAMMNNKPFTQNTREMFNFSMINGVNVYDGWYSGDFNTMVNIFDKFRALSPTRPTFLSEFGAGSDPRIHTYKPQIFDFSSEYQVEFNKHYVNEIEKRDYYVGYSIWNFIDFHVDGRVDVQPNLNNKGMVTADRQPKDSYYYFQARWSKKPMVHIASNFWTERTEVSDSAILTRPISVFSNQPEVELFLNNKSLGKKTVVEGVAEFDIPFQDEKNRLEAIAGNEHNSVEINMHLLATDLSKNKYLTDGLYINIGQDHSYFYDKETDKMWIPDQPYKSKSWGYVDGKKFDSWPDNKEHNGVRNGVAANIKETDLEPVFQTFQMGLTEYKLDVPNGKYSIALFFTEPFSNKEMKDADRTGTSANGERIFDVLINNQTVVDKLNLAKDYGLQTAVEKTFEISSSNGISIKFNAIAGKSVLSGIKIQKI